MAHGGTMFLLGVILPLLSVCSSALRPDQACYSLNCGSRSRCVVRRLECTAGSCPTMVFCAKDLQEEMMGANSCYKVVCSDGFTCKVKINPCRQGICPVATCVAAKPQEVLEVCRTHVCPKGTTCQEKKCTHLNCHPEPICVPVSSPQQATAHALFRLQPPPIANPQEVLEVCRTHVCPKGTTCQEKKCTHLNCHPEPICVPVSSPQQATAHAVFRPQQPPIVMNQDDPVPVKSIQVHTPNKLERCGDHLCSLDETCQVVETDCGGKICKLETLCISKDKVLPLENSSNRLGNFHSGSKGSNHSQIEEDDLKPQRRFDLTYFIANNTRYPKARGAFLNSPQQNTISNLAPVVRNQITIQKSKGQEEIFNKGPTNHSKFNSFSSNLSSTVKHNREDNDRTLLGYLKVLNKLHSLRHDSKAPGVRESNSEHEKGVVTVEKNDNNTAHALLEHLPQVSPMPQIRVNFPKDVSRKDSMLDVRLSPVSYVVNGSDGQKSIRNNKSGGEIIHYTKNIDESTNTTSNSAPVINQLTIEKSKNHGKFSSFSSNLSSIPEHNRKDNDRTLLDYLKVLNKLHNVQHDGKAPGVTESNSEHEKGLVTVETDNNTPRVSPEHLSQIIPKSQITVNFPMVVIRKDSVLDVTPSPVSYVVNGSDSQKYIGNDEMEITHNTKNIDETSTASKDIHTKSAPKKEEYETDVDRTTELYSVTENKYKPVAQIGRTSANLNGDVYNTRDEYEMHIDRTTELSPVTENGYKPVSQIGRTSVNLTDNASRSSSDRKTKQIISSESPLVMDIHKDHNKSVYMREQKSELNKVNQVPYTRTVHKPIIQIGKADLKLIDDINAAHNAPQFGFQQITQSTSEAIPPVKDVHKDHESFNIKEDKSKLKKINLFPHAKTVYKPIIQLGKAILKLTDDINVPLNVSHQQTKQSISEDILPVKNLHKDHESIYVTEEKNELRDPLVQLKDIHKDHESFNIKEDKSKLKKVNLFPNAKTVYKPIIQHGKATLKLTDDINVPLNVSQSPRVQQTTQSISEDISPTKDHESIYVTEEKKELKDPFVQLNRTPMELIDNEHIIQNGSQGFGNGPAKRVHWEDIPNEKSRFHPPFKDNYKNNEPDQKDVVVTRTDLSPMQRASLQLQHNRNIMYNASQLFANQESKPRLSNQTTDNKEIPKSVITLSLVPKKIPKNNKPKDIPHKNDVLQKPGQSPVITGRKKTAMQLGRASLKLVNNKEIINNTSQLISKRTTKYIDSEGILKEIINPSSNPKQIHKPEDITDKKSVFKNGTLNSKRKDRYKSIQQLGKAFLKDGNRKQSVQNIRRSGSDGRKNQTSKKQMLNNNVKIRPNSQRNHKKYESGNITEKKVTTNMPNLASRKKVKYTPVKQLGKISLKLMNSPNASQLFGDGQMRHVDDVEKSNQRSSLAPAKEKSQAIQDQTIFHQNEQGILLPVADNPKQNDSRKGLGSNGLQSTDEIISRYKKYGLPKEEMELLEKLLKQKEEMASLFSSRLESSKQDNNNNQNALYLRQTENIAYVANSTTEAAVPVTGEDKMLINNADYKDVSPGNVTTDMNKDVSLRNTKTDNKDALPGNVTTDTDKDVSLRNAKMDKNKDVSLRNTKTDNKDVLLGNVMTDTNKDVSLRNAKMDNNKDVSLRNTKTDNKDVLPGNVTTDTNKDVSLRNAKMDNNKDVSLRNAKTDNNKNVSLKNAKTHNNKDVSLRNAKTDDKDVSLRNAKTHNKMASQRNDTTLNKTAENQNLKELSDIYDILPDIAQEKHSIQKKQGVVYHKNDPGHDTRKSLTSHQPIGNFSQVNLTSNNISAHSYHNESAGAFIDEKLYSNNSSGQMFPKAKHLYDLNIWQQNAGSTETAIDKNHMTEIQQLKGLKSQNNIDYIADVSLNIHPGQSTTMPGTLFNILQVRTEPDQPPQSVSINDRNITMRDKEVEFAKEKVLSNPLNQYPEQNLKSQNKTLNIKNNNLEIKIDHSKPNKFKENDLDSNRNPVANIEKNKTPLTNETSLVQNLVVHKTVNIEEGYKIVPNPQILTNTVGIDEEFTEEPKTTGYKQLSITVHPSETYKNEDINLTMTVNPVYSDKVTSSDQISPRRQWETSGVTVGILTDTDHIYKEINKTESTLISPHGINRPTTPYPVTSNYVPSISEMPSLFPVNFASYSMSSDIDKKTTVTDTVYNSFDAKSELLSSIINLKLLDQQQNTTPNSGTTATEIPTVETITEFDLAANLSEFFNIMLGNGSKTQVNITSYPKASEIEKAIQVLNNLIHINLTAYPKTSGAEDTMQALNNLIRINLTSYPVENDVEEVIRALNKLIHINLTSYPTASDIEKALRALNDLLTNNMIYTDETNKTDLSHIHVLRTNLSSYHTGKKLKSKTKPNDWNRRGTVRQWNSPFDADERNTNNVTSESFFRVTLASYATNHKTTLSDTVSNSFDDKTRNADETNKSKAPSISDTQSVLHVNLTSYSASRDIDNKITVYNGDPNLNKTSQNDNKTVTNDWDNHQTEEELSALTSTSYKPSFSQIQTVFPLTSKSQVTPSQEPSNATRRTEVTTELPASNQTLRDDEHEEHDIPVKVKQEVNANQQKIPERRTKVEESTRNGASGQSKDISIKQSGITIPDVVKENVENMNFTVFTKDDISNLEQLKKNCTGIEIGSYKSGNKSCFGNETQGLITKTRTSTRDTLELEPTTEKEKLISRSDIKIDEDKSKLVHENISENVRGSDFEKKPILERDNLSLVSEHILGGNYVIRSGNESILGNGPSDMMNKTQPGNTTGIIYKQEPDLLKDTLTNNKPDFIKEIKPKDNTHTNITNVQIPPKEIPDLKNNIPSRNETSISLDNGLILTNNEPDFTKETKPEEITLINFTKVQILPTEVPNFIKDIKLDNTTNIKLDDESNLKNKKSDFKLQMKHQDINAKTLVQETVSSKETPVLNKEIPSDNSTDSTLDRPEDIKYINFTEDTVSQQDIPEFSKQFKSSNNTNKLDNGGFLKSNWSDLKSITKSSNITGKKFAQDQILSQEIHSEIEPSIKIDDGTKLTNSTFDMEKKQQDTTSKKVLQDLILINKISNKNESKISLDSESGMASAEPNLDIENKSENITGINIVQKPILSKESPIIINGIIIDNKTAIIFDNRLILTNEKTNVKESKSEDVTHKNYSEKSISPNEGTTDNIVVNRLIFSNEKSEHIKESKPEIVTHKRFNEKSISPRQIPDFFKTIKSDNITNVKLDYESNLINNQSDLNMEIKLQNITNNKFTQGPILLQELPYVKSKIESDNTTFTKLEDVSNLTYNKPDLIKEMKTGNVTVIESTKKPKEMPHLINQVGFEITTGITSNKELILSDYKQEPTTESWTVASAGPKFTPENIPSKRDLKSENITDVHFIAKRTEGIAETFNATWSGGIKDNKFKDAQLFPTENPDLIHGIGHIAAILSPNTNNITGNGTILDNTIVINTTKEVITSSPEFKLGNESSAKLIHRNQTLNIMDVKVENDIISTSESTVKPGVQHRMSVKGEIKEKQPELNRGFKSEVHSTPNNEEIIEGISVTPAFWGDKVAGNVSTKDAQEGPVELLPLQKTGRSSGLNSEGQEMEGEDEDEQQEYLIKKNNKLTTADVTPSREENVNTTLPQEFYAERNSSLKEDLNALSEHGNSSAILSITENNFINDIQSTSRTAENLQSTEDVLVTPRINNFASNLMNLRGSPQALEKEIFREEEEETVPLSTTPIPENDAALANHSYNYNNYYSSLFKQSPVIYFAPFQKDQPLSYKNTLEDWQKLVDGVPFQTINGKRFYMKQPLLVHFDANMNPSSTPFMSYMNNHGYDILRRPYLADKVDNSIELLGEMTQTVNRVVNKTTPFMLYYNAPLEGPEILVLQSSNMSSGMNSEGNEILEKHKFLPAIFIVPHLKELVSKLESNFKTSDQLESIEKILSTADKLQEGLIKNDKRMEVADGLQGNVFNEENKPTVADKQQWNLSNKDNNATAGDERQETLIGKNKNLKTNYWKPIQNFMTDGVITNNIPKSVQNKTEYQNKIHNRTSEYNISQPLKATDYFQDFVPDGVTHTTQKNIFNSTETSSSHGNKFKDGPINVTSSERDDSRKQTQYPSEDIIKEAIEKRTVRTGNIRGKVRHPKKSRAAKLILENVLDKMDKTNLTEERRTERRLASEKSKRGRRRRLEHKTNILNDRKDALHLNAIIMNPVRKEHRNQYEAELSKLSNISNNTDSSVNIQKKSKIPNLHDIGLLLSQTLPLPRQNITDGKGSNDKEAINFTEQSELMPPKLPAISDGTRGTGRDMVKKLQNKSLSSQIKNSFSISLEMDPVFNNKSQNRSLTSEIQNLPIETHRIDPDLANKSQDPSLSSQIQISSDVTHRVDPDLNNQRLSSQLQSTFRRPHGLELDLTNKSLKPSLSVQSINVTSSERDDSRKQTQFPSEDIIKEAIKKRTVRTGNIRGKVRHPKKSRAAKLILEDVLDKMDSFNGTRRIGLDSTNKSKSELLSSKLQDSFKGPHRIEPSSFIKGQGELLLLLSHPSIKRLKNVHIRNVEGSVNGSADKKYIEVVTEPLVTGNRKITSRHNNTTLHRTSTHLRTKLDKQTRSHSKSMQIDKYARKVVSYYRKPSKDRHRNKYRQQYDSEVDLSYSPQEDEEELHSKRIISSTEELILTPKPAIHEQHKQNKKIKKLAITSSSQRLLEEQGSERPGKKEKTIVVNENLTKIDELQNDSITKEKTIMDDQNKLQGLDFENKNVQESITELNLSLNPKDVDDEIPSENILPASETVMSSLQQSAPFVMIRSKDGTKFQYISPVEKENYFILKGNPMEAEEISQHSFDKVTERNDVVVIDDDDVSPASKTRKLDINMSQFSKGHYSKSLDMNSSETSMSYLQANAPLFMTMLKKGTELQNNPPVEKEMLKGNSTEEKEVSGKATEQSTDDDNNYKTFTSQQDYINNQTTYPEQNTPSSNEQKTSWSNPQFNVDEGILSGQQDNINTVNKKYPDHYRRNRQKIFWSNSQYGRKPSDHGNKLRTRKNVGEGDNGFIMFLEDSQLPKKPKENYATPSVYNLTSPGVYNLTTPSVYNLTTNSIYNLTSPSIYNLTSPSIYNLTSPSVYNLTSPSIYNLTSPSIYNLTSHSIYSLTSPSVYNQTSPSIYNLTSPRVYNLTSPSIYNLTSPRVYNLTSPSIQNLTSPSIHNLTSLSIYNLTSPSIHNLTSPSVYNLTTPSIYSLTTPSIYNLTSPSVYNLTTPSIYNLTSPSVYNLTTSSTYNLTSPSVYNLTTPSIYNLTSPSVYNLTTPSVYNLTTSSTYNLTSPSVYNLTTPSIYNLTSPSVYNLTTPSIYNLTSPSVYNLTTSSTYNLTSPSVYNLTTPSIYNLTSPSVYNLTTPSVYNLTTSSTYNLTSPSVYNLTTPSIYNLTSPSVYNLTTPSVYNLTTPNVYNLTTPSVQKTSETSHPILRYGNFSITENVSEIGVNDSKDDVLLLKKISNWPFNIKASNKGNQTISHIKNRAAPYKATSEVETVVDRRSSNKTQGKHDRLKQPNNSPVLVRNRAANFNVDNSDEENKTTKAVRKKLSNTATTVKRNQLLHPAVAKSGRRNDTATNGDDQATNGDDGQDANNPNNGNKQQEGDSENEAKSTESTTETTTTSTTERAIMECSPVKTTKKPTTKTPTTKRKPKTTTPIPICMPYPFMNLANPMKKVPAHGVNLIDPNSNTKRFTYNMFDPFRPAGSSIEYVETVLPPPDFQKPKMD